MVTGKVDLNVTKYFTNSIGHQISYFSLLIINFDQRSIVHGDKIYHIGGNKNQTYTAPFEEWNYNWEYDNFTITVSNTELSNYYIYPETFIVDSADYAECSFGTPGHPCGTPGNPCFNI